MTSKTDKGGMVWITKPDHLEEICDRGSMYPSVLTTLRENAKIGGDYSTLFGYVVDGSVLMKYHSGGLLLLLFIQGIERLYFS